MLRDGTWQVVPSRDIPGHIVRVRLGDIVPAGESLPVSVAGHLTLFVTWLIVNDCVKRAALFSIGRRLHFAH